jgi:ABC-type transport system involved in multi-copper enzyme maturation permease subunit
MLGALAAERMKLLRHRATLGLVWIFPLAMTAVFAIALGFRLAKGENPNATMDTPEKWMADSTMVWAGVRHFLGLLVMGGFAAFAFGSEYSWNTWKLIVPHAARWRLIAAKYATVLGMLAASLILLSVLSVAYGAFMDGVMGAGLPEGIELGELMRLHGEAALRTLAPALFAISIGSCAAVLLRSPMAGTIVATGLTIGTQVAFVLAPMFDRNVYVALPSYHLRNLSDWVQFGRSLPQPLPDGLLSLDWSTSVAVVAIWIVVPVAVAFLAFQRQDLN